MENKITSAKIGPKPISITLIDVEKCALGQLLICAPPQKSRIYVELVQPRNIEIISGPHFVRGVNSSFYEILYSNKKYYINESYLRDKK